MTVKIRNKKSNIQPTKKTYFVCVNGTFGYYDADSPKEAISGVAQVLNIKNITSSSAKQI